MAAFEQEAGFSFENYKRNQEVLGIGSGIATSYKKTGTTIVGVVCKDGVVLATDTRATGGSIVMEKLCQKLHYMSPNIWCAGAGTAADCDKVTGKSLTYNRKNRERADSIKTQHWKTEQNVHRGSKTDHLSP